MLNAESKINYNSINHPNENFLLQPKDTHSNNNEQQHNNDGRHWQHQEREEDDNGIMMIHVVPETTRWNHIEDLDSFFIRMYSYHQKHGFQVIVLDELFQIFEFAFVVWLITFTTHCVNFPVLFGENKNSTKVYLYEIFYPVGECLTTFSSITIFCLIICLILFIFRMIKVIYHILYYWDIKKFFNTELNIDDNELDNFAWHEVQKKICEVQAKQQMCINKNQLTELDIYHRILRFKNYMVALMNKNLLPCKLKIPIFGEVTALSQGLLYNLEFVLFRGPWSLFENNWQLRGDLAVRSNRIELARRLAKQITWIALINLLLSPLIFLWQLTYILFTYATIIRKEPGSLGIRTWSNYGRLYLRHFNELDHELIARLNRAYEPAEKYMSSFSSPLVIVLARNILFICGGVLVVFVGLGIYEEHVFQVEHVLTIITVLSGIGVVCRILIPDENLIWCPEQLLTAVLAHVHYLPSSWRGMAHTTNVQKEFDIFFQYKATYLFNELVSPIVTPFVLFLSFRTRALDIVDFFRSFTVSVGGVGNVCSFAQMDIRKHGNPTWQIGSYNDPESTNKDNLQQNNINQGEHGKTELSLIHFTLTNPDWKMPYEAKYFLKEIKEHALHDLKNPNFVIPEKNETNNSAMEQSLMSFGSIGDEYSSIARSVFKNRDISIGGLTDSIIQTNKSLQMQSIHQSQPGTSGYDFDKMLHQNLTDASCFPPPRTLQDINEDEEINNVAAENKVNFTNIFKRKGLRKSEGSSDGPKESLLYSLYAIHPQMMSACNTDITTADMCLSTLYMHELHYRQMKRKGVQLAQNQRNIWNLSHHQGGGGDGSGDELSTIEVQTAPTTSRGTANELAESTPLLK